MSRLFMYRKFIIILCCLFVIPFGYSQNNRLVAYYPFNNSADDYSGFGNNGQMIGGVSSVNDRFNNPCSALLFDGSSGYIRVPSSVSLSSPTRSITITVWYKITKSNTDIYWLTVLCKGEGDVELPNNPHYRLQVQQNKSIITNSCTPFPDISSTISISTDFTECDPNLNSNFFAIDAWRFYALTYDGSMVKAFMDGEKIFEYSYTADLFANNAPLYIGKDEPGENEFFNGALDDLKIYNSCLSESDIWNIFSNNEANAYTEDFDISSLPNLVQYTPSNTCAVKTTFKAPTVQSVCIAPNIKQVEGLSSGSPFPLGTNRVAYKLSTPSGYNQFLTFYVTVKDTIAPVIKKPKDVTFTIKSGESGVIYKYNNPTATDNCKIKSIQKIDGLNSGDNFPPGVHEIKYTAIDESENTSTVSFL